MELLLSVQSIKKGRRLLLSNRESLQHECLRNGLTSCLLATMLDGGMIGGRLVQRKVLDLFGHVPLGHSYPCLESANV